MWDNKKIIYFIMLYLVKGNFFLLIRKHLKKNIMRSLLGKDF